MLRPLPARPGALVYSGAVSGAAPLLAFGPHPGWDGTGLSPLQTVGVFVGIPVGLFVVISLLFVYLPSITSGNRYRPGLMWSAEPEWFEGPDNPEEAAEADSTTTGGGASASW